MFTCEFLLISAVFQCADRLTPLELNTLSRCSQTAFKYTRYILLVFIEIIYLHVSFDIHLLSVWRLYALTVSHTGQKEGRMSVVVCTLQMMTLGDISWPR